MQNHAKHKFQITGLFSRKKNYINILAKKFLIYYFIGIPVVILLFIFMTFVIDRRAVTMHEKMFNDHQTLQTLLVKQAIADRIREFCSESNILVTYSLKEYILGKREKSSLLELFKIKHLGLSDTSAFIYYDAEKNLDLEYISQQNEVKQTRKIAKQWLEKYWLKLTTGNDKLFVTTLELTTKKQILGLLFPVTMNNEFKGAFIVFVNLQPVIRQYVAPMKSGQYGNGFLLDGYGNVVYDHESEIIGRNIFDGLHANYPDLMRVDKRLIREASGSDEYTFTVKRNDNESRKLIAWDTVDIGTEKLIVCLSAPDIEIDKTLSEVRLLNNLLGVMLTLFVLVMTYIFIKKRSEELLRESEEKYRTLYETMLQGVVYHDKEGKVISSNPSAENIFGLKNEALINRASINMPLKTIREDGSYFPREQHPSMISLDSGEAITDVLMGIYNPLRKDYRWTIVNATPLYKPNESKPYMVYSTLTDITEQKQTEKALEFKIGLESLIMGISTYFINLALDEVDHGINLSIQLIGQFINVECGYIYLLSEDRSCFDKTHQWCAENDNQQRNIANKLLCSRLPWFMAKLSQFDNILISDLESLPQEASLEKELLLSEGIQSTILVPMVYENNMIGYFSFDTFNETQAWSEDVIGLLKVVGEIFTNALKHKQSEEERDNLIQELEKKNAELERFTYTVSHDLKSPILTIKGFLGLLKKDIEANNSAKITSDIERISSAADKMRQLLEDLLELSRIGRMINPAKTIFMQELIREVIELLNIRLTERNVQINIADDLPNTSGDRPRIYEIIQNLIENAVKFMGDQPFPKINIGCTEEKDYLSYYIQDNGIGIEKPYQDEIFDLFSQLNPKNEGTGIGLTLVKRIIEVHNGRIWVESEGVGKGATFYFTLSK